MPHNKIVGAVKEAKEINLQLRGVSPHLAGPDDLAACEHALSLVDQRRHPVLWCELQLRLGSFLLERREGDRAANVARALGVYRSVLDWSQPESASWEAAVCGFANSLVANPSAEPEAFHGAFELFEILVGRLRPSGDVDRLSVALSCYAMALASAPTGDLDNLLERAIVLQREEVDVLQSASQNPVRWGRAHHKLAKFYLQRRGGVRTQNVDLAITALLEALRVRTRKSDPVGRARTLRGLALAMPEWSGADSQAYADRLAAEFQQEADEIAQADPRAAARPASWGSFAGQRSALNEDLDEYMRLSPEEAVPLFDRLIAYHRSVLERITMESMPREWAEWRAGLGRLLAKRGHLGDRGALQEAYDCFLSALNAIKPSSNPRLYRDISRALGDMCHQVAAWEPALTAYSDTLLLSEHLLDEASAPESRLKELADMRGFALFGAYAASRLERYEDAVRLAEAGRARSLVGMLAAAEIAASGAPSQRRDEVAAASERVRALESELRILRAEDPEAVMKDQQGRLADYLGVDPSLLKMRLNQPAADTRNFAADYLRIASDLSKARRALSDALARARVENPTSLPDRLEPSDIAAIAARSGHPIVYALATVWGGAALVVPPKGGITSILLDKITSDVTGALLFGSGEKPGYADGAMGGTHTALAATLPGVIATLDDAVVAPIAEWLRGHRHTSATIIPMGRLGLLPIHAAALDHGPVLAYAPSARALSRALDLANRPSHERAFCGVADPTESLPCALAEVRTAAGAPGRWVRSTVLVGGKATKRAVTHAAAVSTHLHFACHGLFRPSDPSASALLLADDDGLTLMDLLRGEIDLSAAELAVLSACQTANTEFRTQPDEVQGLPSALLLAGVPRIVCTMWRVDDRAAALFCQQLYEEIFVNMRDAGAAVTSAQRWLRESTAEALQDRVQALRSALAEEDEEAEAVLSEFWRDLLACDPAETPFAAPEHWAAFAYTGI